MFWNPLRKNRWPIALDIGSDSVKMLQLAEDAGQVLVAACGRRKLPSDVQDPQRRRELTVSAVREMLSTAPFRGRRVVTALPCSQLSIKNVRMPHLPAHELREAIRWEAEERFNFPVSPDRLKYLHAGQIRQGTDTQDEIIMIAATEETVKSHLAMVAEMGLRLEHIDAEPVALFRVVERFLRRQGDTESVSVVLDLGAESSRVVVARGRQIVFIKSIDIAGRRFTEAAAKQLNLSCAETAELRSLILGEHSEDARPAQGESKAVDASGVSQSVSWTIHDAVRGEVEAMAREVALCLRYCSVTFRGLRPTSVTITGGQAYDPSVVKLLGEQLNIECVVGQPLKGIDVSNVLLGGNRRGRLAEWALCTGLAIRGVDFEEKLETSNGLDRLSA